MVKISIDRPFERAKSTAAAAGYSGVDEFVAH